VPTRQLLSFDPDQAQEASAGADVGCWRPLVAKADLLALSKV